jgi:hypothetical protein
MKTNQNKPSAKQKRVKVGKLAATKELSEKDAKRVKGGADVNFVKRYDKSSPILP